MATAIYTLDALTALLCTILLLRAYLRGGYRLLLWSSICFAGLSVTNILLVIDKIALPTIDLTPWRTAIALVAMAILLYGMIWDSE
jgi:hydrogenase/urease accessory protein HupE